MVVDFSDIKRIVKGWIDRELDHKMILRHDDPLVAPLQALGEPVYMLDSNPDGGADRPPDFRHLARAGPAGRRASGLGDADARGRHYTGLMAFDLDGTLIDSRRDLAESANELIVELGGAPLSEEAIGRMVGEAPACWSRGRWPRPARRRRPDALARFLEIYDGRLLNHTAPYDGIVESCGSRAAARARGRADEQAAGADASGSSTALGHARPVRRRGRRRRSASAQAGSGRRCAR